MNGKKKTSNRKDKSKSFWQYLAETIWTYGAGVWQPTGHPEPTSPS